MRGGGCLGALLGADALCAVNLVKLRSVRAPRAVSVRRAGGVCLPELWSWELKFCAHMDSQQLQMLGRSHSFCPRMKCQSAWGEHNLCRCFFPV